jgi:hypothetical protein
VELIRSTEQGGTMTPMSTRQKVGLVLAGLLSAANIPSVFTPTPDGDEGPPYAILVVGTVLGVIGLVAVIIAWRRNNRTAVRVAAGALIISVLTSLPAFFVDVPALLKLLVGVSVLLTVLAIGLMLSASRPLTPVMD